MSLLSCTSGGTEAESLVSLTILRQYLTKYGLPCTMVHPPSPLSPHTSLPFFILAHDPSTQRTHKASHDNASSFAIFHAHVSFLFPIFTQNAGLWRLCGRQRSVARRMKPCSNGHGPGSTAQMLSSAILLFLPTRTSHHQRPLRHAQSITHFLTSSLLLYGQACSETAQERVRKRI